MKKLTLVTLESNSQELMEVASSLDYSPELVIVDTKTLAAFSLKKIANKELFIGLENTYLGLPKLQLFKEAVLRKFKLINLISPTAILPSNINLGINIFIGNSCTIKEDCSISDGVFISSACTLGASATIGKFSFIGRDVRIDSDVNIGSHVHIGKGAYISANSIGSFCSLENAKNYNNNLDPMTHDLKGHRNFIIPINNK